MGSKFTYKKSVFSLTFLISLLSLSGCSNEPEICKEGFFEYIVLEPGKYKYYGEGKSIAIIGFTESGLKEESIKIPVKINGIPVEHLGYTGADGAHSKTYIYNIEVSEKDNLKSIYFFDNILYVNPFSYDCNSSVDYGTLNVFCCSKNKFFRNYSENVNLYCYNLNNYSPYCGYTLPNIVYSYNLESDNYYFLDNVSNGDVLTPPADPNYDGYSFNGWFLEKECINKYNFEDSISIANEEHFFLYACWVKEKFA